MHTKSALRSSATPASSYDSPSMTWHQWHHTAPMSSRMGLSSVRARANAASPHGCQCTGWWAADLRYAEGSETRRLDIEGNLPTGRFQIPHHRPRHQLGPDDQAVLVDVERGTVMRRALPLGRRGPDERERAGDAREKVRHVLPSHGPDPVDHTLRRDDFLRDVVHQGRHL